MTFPLDDRTAERIAEVIVDIGGPYERKTYQLEKLLRHAGWPDPPEYDGSPRIEWLAEQLIDRKKNRSDIERLLCRVCDPREYEDGESSAEEFRAAINTRLAAERLVVSRTGGRPVLGELEPDGEKAVFSAPEDLDRRLRRLIEDEEAVDLLVNRVNETRLCQDSGAHTMAIIGIGSFVEGLLHALLNERDAKIRRDGFVGRNGRNISLSRAGLELMLDTAHQKEWIQLDAKDFMHNVRHYRNFIHPRAELEKQPRFDGDSVALCWGPVRAILNDIEERIEPVR
ncbi:hypothetical protein CDG81_14715 [Actinopolyspora erythraea]|uniref:DUF4145 domain-containing protein n=1 Tax=Actinopolyspora erythraea TaxID=414996 RepID=A0A099D5P9_9ACTN|nr:hypothetical protein [Actinopolyspora erythraea]ASU79333.1 hypothetical protein CDG81_14715 [Actinopolyspora erythraea]KGI80680.1 hypothetical protein IL38_15055 [Actinopolyspora erythraea]